MNLDQLRRKIKMNNRIGEVFIRNIFAGILKETDDGYSFIYDEDYLKK